MNHTPQIKRAIQFAARKHHGQWRSETEPLPYITHLFSVALLVAEDGASDDVVSAALLHDTLEDTDTTREELVAAFGEHVAELVEHVSERKMVDGKKPDWKERKGAYLAHLEDAPEDALLISIADKIDNIESMLEEVGQTGKTIFKHFGHSPDEYLWYHGNLTRIATLRLPEHPLTHRLLSVHARERKILSKS